MGIIDSIYNDITHNGEGVIEVTLNSNLRVKKCMFTQIRGRAMHILSDFSYKCVISHVCCFMICSETLAYSQMFFRSNSIECNTTSSAKGISFRYVSLFENFNQIHRGNNYSSCKAFQTYFYMLHTPLKVDCNYLNFADNFCSDIFGVSKPGGSFSIEASKSNVVNTNSSSDADILFHVNNQNGALTLRKWNLFGNRPKRIVPKVLLDSCWADRLSFDVGSESIGVTFANHPTYEVDAWDVPGCHFQLSEMRCTCKHGKLMKTKVRPELILFFGLSLI